MTKTRIKRLTQTSLPESLKKRIGHVLGAASVQGGAYGLYGSTCRRCTASHSQEENDERAETSAHDVSDYYARYVATIPAGMSPEAMRKHSRVQVGSHVRIFRCSATCDTRQVRLAARRKLKAAKWKVLEKKARDADMTVRWFHKCAPSADEIRNFCVKNGMVKEIKDAVSLAEQCFWSSPIILQKKSDPETGDNYIVVAVTVSNKSRQQVLIAYRDFVKQSIALLASPKRGLIRLSYDIAEQEERDPKCATQDIENGFNELKIEWLMGIGPTSSLEDMLFHPAYQKIIALGQAAVPLLLRELEREPDHWFWALQSLTGDDPVPRESYGNVRDMANAWLEWGRKHGHLKS